MNALIPIPQILYSCNILSMKHSLRKREFPFTRKLLQYSGSWAKLTFVAQIEIRHYNETECERESIREYFWGIHKSKCKLHVIFDRLANSECILISINIYIGFSFISRMMFNSFCMSVCGSELTKARSIRCSSLQCSESA